jgi:glycosyltransferase involved in cell wall biosynthesis
MRVLVLTDNDITSENGYRVRVLSEVAELVKNGVQVVVLSFLDVHQLIPRVRGAVAFVRHLRTIGCEVCLVAVFPNFRKHLLLELNTAYKAYWLMRVLRKYHADLIHSHGNTAANLAAMKSPSHSLATVFDMHGAVPEEAKFSLPDMFERAERMEAGALNGSDAVISVSDSLRRYWQNKHTGARPKSLIVPCAVDTSLFAFNQAYRDELRSKWRIRGGDTLFVYSGTDQHYQQINQIAHVFGRVLVHLPLSRILFLVPSRNRVSVERTLQKNGVPSSSYLIKSVHHNQIPAFLSAADLGFLLRRDLKLNHVASPTKFGEYLACGVPVIASPYVDSVRDAITSGCIGHLFKEDDPNCLKDLVRFTMDVMAHRDEWIKKCEAYANLNLSWDKFGPALVTLYSSLTVKSSN